MQPFDVANLAAAPLAPVRGGGNPKKFKPVVAANQVAAVDIYATDQSLIEIFNSTLENETKAAGGSKKAAAITNVSAPTSSWKSVLKTCSECRGDKAKILSAIEGGMLGSGLQPHEKTLMKFLFDLDITGTDLAVLERIDPVGMSQLLATSSPHSAKPLLTFFDHCSHLITPSQKTQVCEFLISHANGFIKQSQPGARKLANEADIKAGRIDPTTGAAVVALGVVECNAEERAKFESYGRQFRKSALEIAYKMDPSVPARNRLGGMALLYMSAQEQQDFIQGDQDRNTFLRFDSPKGVEEIICDLESRDVLTQNQALQNIGAVGGNAAVLATGVTSWLISAAPDVGYLKLAQRVNNAALRTQTLQTVCAKGISSEDFQANMEPSKSQAESTAKKDICLHLIKTGLRKTLSFDPVAVNNPVGTGGVAANTVRTQAQEDELALWKAGLSFDPVAVNVAYGAPAAANVRTEAQEQELAAYIRFSESHKSYCLNLAQAIISATGEDAHLQTKEIVDLIINLASSANPEEKAFALQLYSKIKPKYSDLLLSQAQMQIMDDLDVNSRTIDIGLTKGVKVAYKETKKLAQVAKNNPGPSFLGLFFVTLMSVFAYQGFSVSNTGSALVYPITGPYGAISTYRNNWTRFNELETRARSLGIASDKEIPTVGWTFEGIDEYESYIDEVVSDRQAANEECHAIKNQGGSCDLFSTSGTSTTKKSKKDRLQARQIMKQKRQEFENTVQKLKDLGLYEIYLAEQAQANITGTAITSNPGGEDPAIQAMYKVINTHKTPAQKLQEEIAKIDAQIAAYGDNDSNEAIDAIADLEIRKDVLNEELQALNQGTAKTKAQKIAERKAAKKSGEQANSEKSKLSPAEELRQAELQGRKTAAQKKFTEARDCFAAGRTTECQKPSEEELALLD